MLKSNNENFEDKEKYNNSVILFKSLKNNKIDFDGYKKKLKEYPDLMDVTIYDKIKQLRNFTITDIYNSI